MPNTREKLIELLNQGADMTPCADECWDKKCNDCIREVQADHLIANGVTVQDNTEITDELLKLLRNAPLTVLHEEPTIEVVQEWISVKDRLPKESGEYLAYCGEYDGICVLYYEVLKTKGKWRTKWKDDVTHWMPLPQPPKGE